MTVHVIGAGLSGLAAAVKLAQAGIDVKLYEAAGHAGGRCRSFFDSKLDALIDNGNHLILDANPCTFNYLRAINGNRFLKGITPASFPFFDLKTGESWRLRPSFGPIPFWLWQEKRRIPGTSAGDYLQDIWALFKASSKATVGECLAGSVLRERLWQPLCEAILNTTMEEGQARLLYNVMTKTLFKGELACRPYIAPQGLGAALVDPALEFLAKKKSKVIFHSSLQEISGNRLIFPGDEISLDAKDSVIVALPPWAAGKILDADFPQDFRPIVNCHFEYRAMAMPFIAAVGGNAQWLFQRGNILSITVSAASNLALKPGEEIAEILWRDCQKIFSVTDEIPPWRVIKEQRATLAHSYANEIKRPKPGFWRDNIFLAGDWTQTGFPCTIEGAVSSGFTAARAVVQSGRF